jgi:membrane protein involved in colicin uptake
MATTTSKFSDTGVARTDTAPKKVKVTRTKKQDPLTMNSEDLLAKLTNEPDFATEFLEKFSEIQKVVSEFKKANRERVAAAKAQAQAEKETHDRAKLMDQIAALREVEHSDKLFPDNCVDGLSVQEIKDYIKSTKAIIKQRKDDAAASIKAEKEAKKAEKEAKKMAKQNAKEQKEAEKTAKKAEKEAKQAAKDAVKREKLLAQLAKLVEKDELDFVPEYNDETATDVLAEHVSRCKCAIALAKMKDTISDLPEFDAAEGDIEDLEEMTKRAKLIANLAKMDVELAFNCEHDMDKLKELVAETKEALKN